MLATDTQYCCTFKIKPTVASPSRHRDAIGSALTSPHLPNYLWGGGFREEKKSVEFSWKGGKRGPPFPFHRGFARAKGQGEEGRTIINTLPPTCNPRLCIPILTNFRGLLLLLAIPSSMAKAKSHLVRDRSFSYISQRIFEFCSRSQAVWQKPNPA